MVTQVKTGKSEVHACKGIHPDAPNSGFPEENSTEIKIFIGPWNNPFLPHPALAASSVLLGFI